jgi:nucleotide-binding universal stress UspA family protein
MQLARIVIGVDTTTASTRAAKWVAKRFAPDAEMVLLHCLNPMLLQRQSTEARNAADTTLRDLIQEIGAKRSSYRIRIGDPARCLADLAAEVDADLIAVGAHEEHPDRLPALGTTAERLVRCSPVPVLLCATTPAGAPRSVLLPLESVEVTNELADWTGALAERFDAQLTLIHVEPTDREHLLTSSGAVRRRPLTSTTPWSRVARQRPSDRVFVDAVLGDSAQAVLTESKRFGTELVLLQAPDGDADTNRDSPTSRVLREAACPVLVVPSADNLRLIGTR